MNPPALDGTCRLHALAGSDLDPHVLRQRVLRRLEWQRAVHDPAVEPRNRDPRLAELRLWQARRLETGFRRFLDAADSRPAAEFFLSDLYGDRDFSGRDRDVARVLPKMLRILPASMIAAAGDAVALAALSHAFDVRLAAALSVSLGRGRSIHASAYAQAYREVGLPHLRAMQLALIGQIGAALADAVRKPTLWRLLRMARTPARLAGLDALQSFLERGCGAFRQLADAHGFVRAILAQETEVSRRLFAGDPEPFADVSLRASRRARRSPEGCVRNRPAFNRTRAPGSDGFPPRSGP